MSKDELRSRITIRWKGYGTYKVTIEYRGKLYSCTSHNSLAYDRIDEKGALQAFWDECKRANDLR